MIGHYAVHEWWLCCFLTQIYRTNDQGIKIKISMNNTFSVNRHCRNLQRQWVMGFCLCFDWFHIASSFIVAITDFWFRRNVAWWKFSELLFLHFCASLFFSRYIPPLLLINTKSLTRSQDITGEIILLCLVTDGTHLACPNYLLFLIIWFKI